MQKFALSSCGLRRYEERVSEFASAAQERLTLLLLGQTDEPECPEEDEK